MLYIEDVFHFSRKLAHEENGDKTFYLLFSTAPAASSRFGVFCVIDGVSTANPALSSALAQKKLRSAVASLVVDADSLTETDEEARTKYFYALMRNAILSADRLLFEYPDKNCACSVSMAIVFENAVYVANVGDSPVRLADLTRGTIKDIYTSHGEGATLARSGKLTEEEAKHYKYKNVLHRVVGGARSLLEPADVFTQRHVLSQDSVLLLGSDGALSTLDEEALDRIVFSNREDMKQLCSKVYESVVNAGGKDDTSMIAVRIKKGV
jgi:serine/threonine protein phosphatase PrpC